MFSVSNPPPAAEIIEEDKRQERIMEDILNDIMTGELEELINRKFVVIKTIHSYKDVLHGECYPAELAMASFNVLSGFKRYYWTLIDACEFNLCWCISSMLSFTRSSIYYLINGPFI